jgi:hypothetical protein
MAIKQFKESWQILLFMCFPSDKYTLTLFSIKKIKLMSKANASIKPNMFFFEHAT